MDLGALEQLLLSLNIYPIPLQQILESVCKSMDYEQKLKYSKRCINIIEIY